MRCRGPWKREEERKWSAKVRRRLRENCSAIPFLGEGAMVALAVQLRKKGATEQTADQIGQTRVEALIAAGFRLVRLERRAMKPVSTVYAPGIK